MGQKNKKESSSWKVFFMGIGFLFILFSNKNTYPPLSIAIGLLIIIVSAIWLKKTPKKKG